MGARSVSRCGIVLDEGVHFRTNQIVLVQTKRKFLDDCDLHFVASLPGGVFTAAGKFGLTYFLTIIEGRTG